VTDDSEAIAALARQVAELRGIVTSWDARLETEGIGGTMKLLLEVKRLRERLDKALEGGELEESQAPWWCVGQTEGRAMLAELGEWVEGFARRHYPGYMARLPQCWANHPEAVWELSTLRAEWQRVYDDEDNRDLQGALVWHDKWFPDVLSRLAAAIRCDPTGCQMVRPPPR
jgi:hypothetical protein